MTNVSPHCEGALPPASFSSSEAEIGFSDTVLSVLWSSPQGPFPLIYDVAS